MKNNNTLTIAQIKSKHRKLKIIIISLCSIVLITGLFVGELLAGGHLFRIISGVKHSGVALIIYSAFTLLSLLLLIGALITLLVKTNKAISEALVYAGFALSIYTSAAFMSVFVSYSPFIILILIVSVIGAALLLNQMRHLFLLVLALFWLIPIIWLVLNSFSEFQGVNIRRFIPDEFSLTSYRLLLFDTEDTVARFPVWFMNTLQIAIFSCIISSIFVLMVSYAMSRMRFKGRRSLMSVGVILGLFPGFLAMIAVYFILRTFGLTNSHWGLVLIYSGSSGLGYLIAKGFFDTISETLSESARIDGATEEQVFRLIIIPLSKPIIVYTVIGAFLAPWMDFMFANIMLNSGIATDWTVAMGLYRMIDRTFINTHFARFCAGGVLVSIPISILFVIMQKFYVEGITGGSVKG